MNINEGNFLGPHKTDTKMISNPSGEFLKIYLFNAENYAKWNIDNTDRTCENLDCEITFSTDWTINEDFSRYTKTSSYYLVIYCDNSFFNCDFSYDFDMNFNGITHEDKDCDFLEETGKPYYNNVIKGQKQNCDYDDVNIFIGNGYQCWIFNNCSNQICGDNFCDSVKETCENCETDCGSCPEICGNGICGIGETCENCETDCGSCECVYDSDCYFNFGYNFVCINNKCACIPDCQEAECGDDSCGGTCGECKEGYTCGFSSCYCDSNLCIGRTCGDDGCGNSCGICDKNTQCLNGKCISKKVWYEQKWIFYIILVGGIVFLLLILCIIRLLKRC